MDLRRSFSQLKGKVKRLGSKHKPGGAGADVGGESGNPANPPSRPGPYVVGDGDDNGADADGQQASSTDQPPVPDEPETVPIVKPSMPSERGRAVQLPDGGFPHPLQDPKLHAGRDNAREHPRTVSGSRYLQRRCTFSYHPTRSSSYGCVRCLIILGKRPTGGRR